MPLSSNFCQFVVPRLRLFFVSINGMIKNKKLIITLVAVLIVVFSISLILLRDQSPKSLKAGDKDPETGCIITDDGGAICNGAD